jgi:uncharacterized protein YggT (Ycf19 family)
MSLIDFILNLAGLLIWLNWRAAEPVLVAPGETAPGAMPQKIRPPRSRWWYFAGLILLLVGRAFFYWQAGTSLHWQPGIHFSSLWLAFRSDFPGRMLLYSCFSFGATVGFFYLCLLLISSVNGPASDTDAAQRLVRLHLGRLDRWPRAVKLLLPLVVMTAFWCSLNPLLLRIDMVPKVSAWQLLAQGALIGLAGYLTLKFLIVGFLTVYVLNSYIYLGESHFLKFVNTTSTGLLRPLRWLPLRVGRVDLAPLAGMALVMVAAEFGRRGLDRLYH